MVAIWALFRFITHSSQALRLYWVLCYIRSNLMTRIGKGLPVAQSGQWGHFLSSFRDSALILLVHVVTVWKCFLQDSKRHSLRLKSSCSNGQAKELQWGVAGWWTLLKCFRAKSHHNNMYEAGSLPGCTGAEGAHLLLCRVQNYQLLVCELIVNGGRLIPAAPSLTSHLIIHTDNRQTGTEGTGSHWLTGTCPGLYIMSVLLGDKDAHQRNNH